MKKGAVAPSTQDIVLIDISLSVSCDAFLMRQPL